MKSVNYLKKLQESKKWSSYRMAKELDISTQAMYQLMDEKTVMSDYVAVQVADFLGIDEMEIISLCNSERTKKETEKDYWMKKFRKLVACVIVSATTIYGGILAGSSTIEEVKNAVLYTNSAVIALFFIFILFRITYIMLNRVFVIVVSFYTIFYDQLKHFTFNN